MDEIIIVDYGSQYTSLLARMIRKIGVFSRIVDAENLCKSERTKGIILSGGPQSVYDQGALMLPEELSETSVPVLGICYGMHLLIHNEGGEVARGEAGEYGAAKVHYEQSELFDGVPPEAIVWMSHADSTVSLPESFQVIARSNKGEIAGVKMGRFYGLQFHPEVSHTEYGEAILSNFVCKICGAACDWSVEDLENVIAKNIRKEVGDRKVVAGLSGGVDSTVSAVLAAAAIGERLVGVFVDHGLMRENEGHEILEILRTLGVKTVSVDARALFFERLRGVDDPEEKRRIIGRCFIEVFEKEAARLGASFLLQGTIMSDVIESGRSSKAADRIKSHHNVAGLPENMDLMLLEPLRQLFKDEVRYLGRRLGIPNEFLERHPFPGPGLGVRVLGEITPEKVSILQKADRIFLNILREAQEDQSVWQAFAVLLPVRSVGVKGDRRSYGYVIALRAVESSEGMTASARQFPWGLLKEAASAIVSNVPEVSRVVYDLTDKPPGTIEWE